MNELNSALYSRLASATALTALLAHGSASIFDRQAAEGTLSAYPYVVWNLQGGGDLNDNPHRVKSLVLYIRAYGTTARQAGSIDAQIDTALHLVPFTSVTGWSNTWLARETDLELVENPPDGGQIFMQGGLYRSRLAK